MLHHASCMMLTVHGVHAMSLLQLEVPFYLPTVWQAPFLLDMKDTFENRRSVDPHTLLCVQTEAVMMLAAQARHCSCKCITAVCHWLTSS